MKFVRTEEYEQKLLEQAFFDDKHVIKNANIHIEFAHGKLKAYCKESNTFLQFPRSLRNFAGERYTADVVEVIRTDDVQKYYRVVKGSIRTPHSDEVIC